MTYYENYLDEPASQDLGSGLSRAASNNQNQYDPFADPPSSLGPDFEYPES